MRPIKLNEFKILSIIAEESICMLRAQIARTGKINLPEVQHHYKGKEGIALTNSWLEDFDLCIKIDNKFYSVREFNGFKFNALDYNWLTIDELKSNMPNLFVNYKDM